MRFDDSLKTVLAADIASDFGAQSAFRQIVDLVGRRRVPADAAVMARLRMLRGQVPIAIRAASARSLALANPPAALVRVFGEDEATVAAPVLRIARLSDPDWLSLLAGFGPAGRSVLRARDDLSAEVVRGLAAFGSTDFTIGYDAPATEPQPASSPVYTGEPQPVDQPATPPMGNSPFVALGAIARELPLVAEALRRSDPDLPPEGQRFEIADLVDRIETFQRDRERIPAQPVRVLPGGFRFETDADGTIGWVEGASRGALIGLPLALGGRGAAIDSAMRSAFRMRAAFRDTRLVISGRSDFAGDWRVSGAPMFEPRSGRFLGMRGQARRPRADEDTAAVAQVDRGGAEALRRLVHELRTPTNAISGFAELIETELLGPVVPVHRDRAGTIRHQITDLIDAIDDLDTAARIESDALDLRDGESALEPLVAAAVDRLAQLAAQRECSVAATVPETIFVTGDPRAIDRLVSRLVAVAVSAAEQGEVITVAARMVEDCAEIAISRPVALRAIDSAALFSVEADPVVETSGAPLLGTGFAMRLARNIARELCGSLEVGPDRLTLTLPAGFNRDVQASIL